MGHEGISVIRMEVEEPNDSEDEGANTEDDRDDPVPLHPRNAAAVAASLCRTGARGSGRGCQAPHCLPRSRYRITSDDGETPQGLVNKKRQIWVSGRGHRLPRTDSGKRKDALHGIQEQYAHIHGRPRRRDDHAFIVPHILGRKRRNVDDLRRVAAANEAAWIDAHITIIYPTDIGHKRHVKHGRGREGHRKMDEKDTEVTQQ
ncbi:hypothetical protein B0H17DRAFT_1147594 [Mycena rosella]|uniref:Uncharacterized protein n=1 Tax=Mycena rosella TaxID=1033263 RepID=A0AAD7CLH3_MYCRO|nr:hypothetical protein B0H17DRAFT_1147594 [Mycena rosella]